MNKSDFEAVLSILKEEEGFCYFNSGELSGATQGHKHVQFVPYRSLIDSNNKLPLEEYILHLKTAYNKHQLFSIDEFNFPHQFMFHNKEDSSILFN